MERKKPTRMVYAAAAAAVALAAGCHPSRSVSDYLSAGDQAMQKTELSQAEENYRAAAGLAPNDPRVHVALGNLYIFEQRPTLAQAEFLKVLELDPANAAAHSALGGLYEGQSQLGAAEEQFRAAVALKPSESNYRLSLGELLAKQGKAVEAEAEMRTAIGLAPKNARAHLALANLLNTMPARKSEADAEFAQVRLLDPHLLPVPAPAAAPPAAEAAATPAAAAPSGATAAKAAKFKPLNRRFKLTHDSPVYQAADSGTSVVGQVHRGKFVHVTGIQGNYLQVTLRNGTVGFIPVTAAE
ncbi:MAG TPA: tetratricopeptide repeat protein [Candidatus Binataceae bacterium]|nr:tetratricopeptide repeat protein [Candidatus Binataceae bacterium]